MVDLAEKHSQWSRVFAKAGIVVLGAGVLGAAGWLGYVRYFPRILLHEARGALASGDSRDAALFAERAYQIRGTEVNAMRLLADIADQQGQYVALEWRKKVVESEPDSLPDILACASTALHFGQAQVAKETLAKATGVSSNANYHALNAYADSLLGDLSDAEREAGEATNLDPGNEDYEMTLASIQLKTRRADVRGEARKTLEALMKVPRLRMAAERFLMDDYLANGESGAAEKLGETVVSEKESQFSDRLTYLTALNKSGDPKFRPYLESLEAASAGDGSKIGALVDWMRTAGLNLDAFEWVKALPPAMGRSPEAGASIALCYVDTGHWQELHELIKDGTWGRMEYLRQAFLAHTAEMLGNRVEFDLESNAAMGETTGDAQAQRVLAQYELDWGWQGEAQRTLSDIVKTAYNRGYVDWALRNLYQIYEKQGDVGQLAIVTQKLAELSPEDDVIENNFVMFSLLTRSNLLTVLPLAETLYKRHPGDPVYVSTYAYSLLVGGNNQEAMKVILTLPEEDRRTQGVAPYCGIILAANKEKESAKGYLDLVDESKLLPREAELVDAARVQTQ
jgi:tetratricopeptide (TPR) repeat protein